MKKQDGFGVPETIVLLVVVLFACLGGWYVSNRNNPQPPDNRPTAQRQAQKQSNSTDLSEGGKYIVIKEWGVRFLKPSGFQPGDIVYKLKHDMNLAHSEPAVYGDVAYFASTSLSEIDPATNVCDLNDDNIGPGILLSRSVDRPEPANKIDQKLGSYWYEVARGNGGGCYASSDGMKEVSFMAAMATNLVNTLEAIPAPSFE